MLADAKNGARWTRQANIARYLRILDTPLTDLERQYVEQRLERATILKLLAEEEKKLKGCSQVIKKSTMSGRESTS